MGERRAGSQRSKRAPSSSPGAGEQGTPSTAVGGQVRPPQGSTQPRTASPGPAPKVGGRHLLWLLPPWSAAGPGSRCGVSERRPQHASPQVRGRSAPPCVLALSPHLGLDASRFWVTPPGRRLSLHSAHIGPPEPHAGRAPALQGRGWTMGGGPAGCTETAWAGPCEALLRQRGPPFRVTPLLPQARSERRPVCPELLAGTPVTLPARPGAC